MPGQQRRIDQGAEQLRRGGVAHQQVRVAIEDDRAVRLVAVEDELQDAADVAHLVGGERRLAVDVRVAAGLEQPVPLAQRHVERFGEDQQRLTARLRAPGFDEADMPGREPGAHREIELAEPRAPTAIPAAAFQSGSWLHPMRPPARRPLPPR